MYKNRQAIAINWEKLQQHFNVTHLYLLFRSLSPFRNQSVLFDC